MSTSTQNGSIRVITWNLNHRAKRHQIPRWIAGSILSAEPDVVVLTEYVEGADHRQFVDDLKAGGLAFFQKTDYTPKENQILIASRESLVRGNISAPGIYSSVPQNVLHVRQNGVDILGFRMPSGKAFDRPYKRSTWDWLLGAATQLGNKPAIVVGDFNTAPGDTDGYCGDCLEKMAEIGWSRAASTGYSWKGRGVERQIDHIFTSPSLTLLDAEYKWNFQELVPDAASGKVGIPDHAMLVADVAAAD